MDDTVKTAAGGLAFALALGACAGPESEAPTPAPTGAAAVEESIRLSLDRLRALELVDLGRLVIRLPAEATACYCRPCPGWESRVQEERARQAPRLAALTDLATTMAPAADLPPRPVSEAAAAAAALSALEIVEINGLILTQPAVSAACYNLPCPADVEAAERENRRRVAAAFAIGDSARRSGL
jgi:hypothetical protein